VNGPGEGADREGRPGAGAGAGTPVTEAGWQLVCTSAALLEGGDGVRFEVRVAGATEPAFVVRYGGTVRAYLNHCRHIPVELDWMPGRFFDDSGLYLICATHGATYQPDDGLCVAGPCRGASLIPVPARESDGQVWAATQLGTG